LAVWRHADVEEKWSSRLNRAENISIT